jgi:hypothetical protein
MKLNIKKYIDDPSLTWEERYKRLEAHHLEETNELIRVLKELNNYKMCRIREVDPASIEEWKQINNLRIRIVNDDQS